MDKKDYIFGVRSVMEALEAGKTIDKVLVKRDSNSDLMKELLPMLKERDIPVQKVPLEKLNRITMKNHQGVIAILSPVVYYKLENLIPAIYEEGKTPMAIILDGVTDARNFGAIARSLDCAGGDFIVIPEKGSVSVTSDAVKASAGALFHVPVCRVKDLKSAIKELRENGIKVIGASEKAQEIYTEEDMKVPVAIVMGAEDKGLSEEVIRNCDALVSIPIKGNVGSLNVSVAAGVLLFECVRQRM